MTQPADGEALAAILDALTLVSGQLEEIGEQTRRLEAHQSDILARLDALEEVRSNGSSLQADVDKLLIYVAEGASMTKAGLERVAEVAGFAHAAAVGNRAPLPVDVVDDPLLEPFLLSQPADTFSSRRALLDWRRRSAELDSGTLTVLLRRQYQPSPTDGRDGRILRYQLAAITRAELLRREVDLPPPPRATTAVDRSAGACEARSQELLALWRAGDEAAIAAEPELAGALDIIAAAMREGARLSEPELSAGLADLRRTISARLEAGERLMLTPQVAGTMVPEDRDRSR